MLSKNVIMGESTLEFLEKELEKHCTDIKIFNYQRKVVVYPVSLGIKQAIEQIIQLKKLSKSRVFEDSAIVTLCGKCIKQKVSKLQDSLPWPPQPGYLYPEKFKIPESLNVFVCVD